MNWGGSLSWDDERERQRQQTGKPRNRRTVELITCPTCDGHHVERIRVGGAVSYWKCNAGKNCENWKEPAAAGAQGKGQIA